MPLPTSIEKFTIMRSTFIDKDSREQFEVRTHKRLLDIVPVSYTHLDVYKRQVISSVSADMPPVREDEEPWTEAELREVRQEIERDIARGLADIATAEEDLQGLIWDAGDGSGDDQADAGAKTYEREQEISLANISRDKLAQNRHALERCV